MPDIIFSVIDAKGTNVDSIIVMGYGTRPLCGLELPMDTRMLIFSYDEHMGHILAFCIRAMWSCRRLPVLSPSASRPEQFHMNAKNKHLT